MSIGTGFGLFVTGTVGDIVIFFLSCSGIQIFLLIFWHFLLIFWHFLFIIYDFNLAFHYFNLSYPYPSHSRLCQS